MQLIKVRVRVPTISITVRTLAATAVDAQAVHAHHEDIRHSFGFVRPWLARKSGACAHVPPVPFTLDVRHGADMYGPSLKEAV
jgi:hypothetical protein